MPSRSEKREGSFRAIKSRRSTISATLPGFARKPRPNADRARQEPSQNETGPISCAAERRAERFPTVLSKPPLPRHETKVAEQRRATCPRLPPATRWPTWSNAGSAVQKKAGEVRLPSTRWRLGLPGKPGSDACFRENAHPHDPAHFVGAYPVIDGARDGPIASLAVGFCRTPICFHRVHLNFPAAQQGARACRFPAARRRWMDAPGPLRCLRRHGGDIP